MSCSADYFSDERRAKCPDCGKRWKVRLRKLATVVLPPNQFDPLLEKLALRLGSVDSATERLLKWGISSTGGTADKQPRPKRIRNKSLPYMKLGFANYDQYLASDLWWNIRERVLARDGGLCRLCSTVAETVHHQSYDLETMRGRSIDQLFSLCNSCHHRVEFDGRSKRTHQAAKDELVRLLLLKK